MYATIAGDASQVFKYELNVDGVIDGIQETMTSYLFVQLQGWVWQVIAGIWQH